MGLRAVSGSSEVEKFRVELRRCRLRDTGNDRPQEFRIRGITKNYRAFGDVRGFSSGCKGQEVGDI